MKPQPDLEIHTAAVSDLVPYAHNAKLHSQLQVGQIADSMREFGNCDPIAVWHNPQGDMEIVEGHGRVLALQRLGIDTCPVIYLDHLSDEQRRAYTHVHNQLTLNSGFDMSVLESDLDSLDFDWGSFGFDDGEIWFENRKKWDSQKGDSAEHDAFLEKFENKKTTDDCYTPDNVYEAVAEWVESEYNIDRASMVSPFYPGGDYESYHYPEGCCVVDNPPFSILSEILKFYCKKGIQFFLFAPTLTLFSPTQPELCYLPCAAQVVYENGANVNTSFITNLDPARIRTVPALYAAIDKANKENLKEQHKELASYEYPNEVVVAAPVAKLSKYGVALTIARVECVKVTALDVQKAEGKGIFGGGFLLSKQAAAKQAAAKQAAAKQAAIREATYWELSERERAIVETLGGAHAED